MKHLLVSLFKKTYSAALMLILLLAVGTDIKAKSFGVVGEVFPVAELSLLTLIENRITELSDSGELETFKQRWVQRAALQANRPAPLRLPRALKSRMHYYKPEIVLTNPIFDAEGKVLFPVGTQVNALASLPTYQPCWLFFNADDWAQLLWAQSQMKHCANPKLILTGGAVSIVEKALQTAIYFDQEGRITEKLKIKSVPARVTRQGNQLLIEEQAIKENGDVL